MDSSPIRPALVATLVTCGALLSPSRAAAGVGQDEVRALYSNRFGFDRRGVPLISVRIMEGQSRVVVTSRTGVHVQPFGTSSTGVKGATSWTLTLQGGRAARARHWVVLERFPGAGGGAAAKAIKRWRDRGLKARSLEVGTLFAVGGRVVDNRTTLVVVRPDPNPQVAAMTARQVAQKYKIRTTVHRELLRRPRGRIIARPGGSQLELHNAEVLWLAPAGKDRLTVKRVEYGRGYRWHGRKDRQFFGRVYVTVDRTGKLAVVNEVPADHLLYGLVPAEIFTSAPMGALKAQSVAARGQLLAKIGTRHTTDPYLICSAQHCQVYSGVGSEHPRTSQAVRATRGQILVDAGGRLADTVYSACCGGFSEHNEHVWNTPANPNLRGRLDASAVTSKALGRFVRGIDDQNISAWLKASPSCYCRGTSFGQPGKFRWKQRLEQSVITRLVQRSHRIGAVRDVQVLSRGHSGRATALRIRGSRSTVVVHGELTIRRLLGNLRSSMFVVRRLRSATGASDFLFTGGGWGHGVGMCQTGAIGMAQAKFTFERILSHYYRKTRLLKLY
ncbi:MAG: SpoIID/LytB domain-containing protein [bacterium]